MELISQKDKKIMEGCKERARDAGLRFDNETLEYIVTNRDLIDLMPKGMIPTLYDYWVHDVEVLKGKGKYELYPYNPYETVINTRPAISYYNDNNPDWLNVMIFYHVLAHIDFFQNNLYFRHTWNYDFLARALADKRMIADLRVEKGRFVDYVIEFSRSFDNLVLFYSELDNAELLTGLKKTELQNMYDYYFDVYLQRSIISGKSDKAQKRAQKWVHRRQQFYVQEIARFNECMKKAGGNETNGLGIFFYGLPKDMDDPEKTHQSFQGLPVKCQNFFHIWESHEKEKQIALLRGESSLKRPDPLQYILRHSMFLNNPKNRWMKPVVEIVRQTSLFFQPQIRTKIINEGWASYWHEALFLKDDRISGHEVDFAQVHSGVTAMPRVGLNPYALGMRLFQHLEDIGNKTKTGFEYEKITDQREREMYNKPGDGKKMIFDIRASLNDILFLNNYINQDFVDRFRLFVAGRRLNESRGVWEIYVKSRSAEDYRNMILPKLYHPPKVTIQEDGASLKLVHHFEKRPLVKEFIANTLMGAEYLWGAPVELETSEVDSLDPYGNVTSWRRVLYIMEDRKLRKEKLTTPTGTEVAG